jgi:anti-sigma regulatory factor (Ser/Thr protein kinase)
VNSRPGGEWPVSSTYELPASLASPSLARGFARSALAGCPEDVVDTVLLLVSEVITNAVVHGQSAPRMHIQVVAGQVRVSVDDEAIGAPVVPVQGVESLEAGRGLMLVDALATRWGWTPIEQGKRTWFEM